MKKVLLISFLLCSGLSYSFAQKNEIQLRYNYIGNQYDRFYNSSSIGFDFDNKDFITNINTHPFRFHDSKRENQDDKYFSETTFCKYFSAGLVYQRDSLWGHYFMRFRIDRFSFNYKSETIDNGWLTSSYNLRVCRNSTKLSSTQFTLGFGRTLKLKCVELEIGSEIPFYFRGDQESISGNTLTDSSGCHNDSFFWFVPGGYFTGISLFANLGFKLNKFLKVGVDGSCGLIYLNNFGVKEYHLTYHYPSLSFIVKF